MTKYDVELSVEFDVTIQIEKDYNEYAMNAAQIVIEDYLSKLKEDKRVIGIVVNDIDVIDCSTEEQRKERNKIGGGGVMWK